MSERPPNPAQPAWPLWDGKESVADYAHRSGLEPAKTLDLGKGVELDLVLVPAGTYTMGAQKPPGPGELPEVGHKLCGIGIALAIGLLAVMLLRAWRDRERPKFSLRGLLAFTLAASVAIFGAVRSWNASNNWNNFQDELRRYQVAYVTEEPPHKVTISRPFYMGKGTVTQEQYLQVMGTRPSRAKGPKLPVENVSWFDARNFCRELSKQSKVAARLPTEAEWEYACRAGSDGLYLPMGEALDRIAWHAGNSGGNTHPVGQKQANAFGLHDMLGNVWEWCRDRYDEDYYSVSPEVDPPGPSEGNHYVKRGGACSSQPGELHVTQRRGHEGDYPVGNIGFRVVIEAGPAP